MKISNHTQNNTLGFVDVGQIASSLFEGVSSIWSSINAVEIAKEQGITERYIADKAEKMQKDRQAYEKEMYEKQIAYAQLKNQQNKENEAIGLLKQNYLNSISVWEKDLQYKMGLLQEVDKVASFVPLMLNRNQLGAIDANSEINTNPNFLRNRIEKKTNSYNKARQTFPITRNNGLNFHPNREQVSEALKTQKVTYGWHEEEKRRFSDFWTTWAKYYQSFIITQVPEGIIFYNEHFENVNKGVSYFGGKKKQSQRKDILQKFIVKMNTTNASSYDKANQEWWETKLKTCAERYKKNKEDKELFSYGNKGMQPLFKIIPELFNEELASTYNFPRGYPYLFYAIRSSSNSGDLGRSNYKMNISEAKNDNKENFNYKSFFNNPAYFQGAAHYGYLDIIKKEEQHFYENVLLPYFFGYDGKEIFKSFAEAKNAVVGFAGGLEELELMSHAFSYIRSDQHFIDKIATGFWNKKENKLAFYLVFGDYANFIPSKEKDGAITRKIGEIKVELSIGKEAEYNPLISIQKGITSYYDYAKSAPIIDEKEAPSIIRKLIFSEGNTISQYFKALKDREEATQEALQYIKITNICKRLNDKNNFHTTKYLLNYFYERAIFSQEAIKKSMAEIRLKYDEAIASATKEIYSNYSYRNIIFDYKNQFPFGDVFKNNITQEEKRILGNNYEQIAKELAEYQKKFDNSIPKALSLIKQNGINIAKSTNFDIADGVVNFNKTFTTSTKLTIAFFFEVLKVWEKEQLNLKIDELQNKIALDIKNNVQYPTLQDKAKESEIMSILKKLKNDTISQNDLIDIKATYTDRGMEIAFKSPSLTEKLDENSYLRLRSIVRRYTEKNLPLKKTVTPISYESTSTQSSNYVKKAVDNNDENTPDNLIETQPQTTQTKKEDTKTRWKPLLAIVVPLVVSSLIGNNEGETGGDIPI